MNKYTIAVVLLAFAACLFFTNQCSYKKGLNKSIAKVDSVFIYDSIPVIDTVKITEPTITYLSTPSKIDTNEVIRDYFSRKTYDVNERFNDCIIAFKPVVEKGELLPFTMSIKNTRPIEFSTYQPKDKSRWGISAHVGYGLSKEGLSPYIGVGVSYDIFRFR